MYIIKGKYKNLGWEDIDEFETKQECEKMLLEYKLAYGNDWILKIVKGGK